MLKRTAETNVQPSELHGKGICCTVFFLDDSHENFQISKKVKGQFLLDAVFQHLELIEREYFGLQFSDDSHGVMQWLDPTKCVRKQMKSKLPCVFYFRVKFYVSDPSKLHEEYTRYHLYLQLKKDFLIGKLIGPLATSILLASYIVQAEVGDFNPEKHLCGYLNNFHLIPNQTEEMEKKITDMHKLHSGQKPADAEFNFLDHAKKLDMYGINLYAARSMDPNHSEIQLSASSLGVVVFQNSVKINTFSWAKIVKISFKEKQFFIQLRREGTEKFDSMLGFNMLNYRSCKNLWKSCIEHHSFFRLHVNQLPTKQVLFSFGSKFHYSGRTEYETQESKKHIVKSRSRKLFTRSPSKQCKRQTLQLILKEGHDISERKTSKMMSRMNGAASSVQIHPCDNLNNRIVMFEAGRKPREAWIDTLSSENVEYTGTQEMLNFHAVDDHNSVAQDHINGFNVYDDPESLVMIKMKSDKHGHFGFNVKGGADQHLPILVSRVVPNTAADMCIPRLNEGDQLLLINNKDVTGLTHKQVVSLIRCTWEKPSRELFLTVRPNVYLGEDVEEPDFQYIPDVSLVSSKIPKSGVLSESMLLLGEGLDSGAIIGQFEQLYRKKPGMTMNAARLPENATKNRYRDILPYDSTRVILHQARSGDYINASHVEMEVPASGILNRYIATQGPLPATALDFWEMVYEQQASMIIMVTALMERGRIQCHKYWPSLNDSYDFGSFKVTCFQEEENNSFTFRELALHNNETHSTREISHMQYMSWPDHGIPPETSDFLHFFNKISQKKIRNSKPTIIHCSAGIGRTGVLIFMDTAMCLIEANEPIYPLDIVKRMRDQRAMLIQTTNQYKFVCETILKVYNGSNMDKISS